MTEESQSWHAQKYLIILDQKRSREIEQSYYFFSRKDFFLNFLFGFIWDVLDIVSRMVPFQGLDLLSYFMHFHAWLSHPIVKSFVIVTFR